MPFPRLSAKAFLLFVTLPISQIMYLLRELTDLQITETPASIYGYRISSDYEWWVDKAEI